MKPSKITMPMFQEYRENYVGFCTECCDWINEGVEPDATEYPCDICGEPAVIGAEEALLCGYIIIIDDGEEYA